MKINQFLADKLDLFADLFTAEYYRSDLGEDRRFPSAVTALFRKLLCYPLFVLAALLVAAVIYGIVKQNPFLDLLLLSLLRTVLFALALLFLLFVMMLFEALAKVAVSLILYEKLPDGAENPVDGLVAYLVRGRL